MPRQSVFLVRTAFLYFGFGFSVGALILANKGIPFWPPAWTLIPLHIEFLLVGWLLQFAIGIAYWIIPRFSGNQKRGIVWMAWAGYALLNAGVLLVVAGAVFAGRLMQMAAVGLFISQMWARVKPLEE